MNSLLDLRFVIGLFFLVIAILLLVYSFTNEGRAASINLWCGVVFGAFGLLMFFLSLRKGDSDEVLDHDNNQ